MKIWLDILHTPQLNFYKNFIRLLSRRGDTVLVTVLRRGKLPAIAARELGSLPGVEIYEMGRHRMSKMSALIEANLLRYASLWNWARKHRADVAFSNGCQACLVAKSLGIPAYSFGDDPGSLDNKLKAKTGVETYLCLYELPEGMRLNPNETLMSSLKEWAYLNEQDFKPDVSAPAEYGLKPFSYYFFREVSVGTVNYAGQAPDCILQLADKVPQGVHVLLSLEKKDQRDKYPADWILLREPLRDIHSLIYYSRGLISSGDSMAREAALLGVPAYYLGIRHNMPANLSAATVADFSSRATTPVAEWLDRTAAATPCESDRTKLREAIGQRFSNVTDFMLSLAERALTPSKIQMGGGRAFYEPEALRIAA